jgi:hypothetical protein
MQERDQVIDLIVIDVDPIQLLVELAHRRATVTVTVATPTTPVDVEDEVAQ